MNNELMKAHIAQTSQTYTHKNSIWYCQTNPATQIHPINFFSCYTLNMKVYIILYIVHIKFIILHILSKQVTLTLCTLIAQHMDNLLILTEIISFNRNNFICQDIFSFLSFPPVTQLLLLFNV